MYERTTNTGRERRGEGNNNYSYYYC